MLSDFEKFSSDAIFKAGADLVEIEYPVNADALCCSVRKGSSVGAFLLLTGLEEFRNGVAECETIISSRVRAFMTEAANAPA